MLYAVKWHQMSSLSLICGWNYKLVEKSEPNRRMPLVSNCQDKFCTTPISLSFLLSNINIPFLHLFCGRSARHTYGNTIKPVSCTVHACCLFSNAHIFKSTYDDADHRKRETKNHESKRGCRRGQNQVALNCSVCESKHFSLFFCNRIPLVLQTSD